MVWRVFAWVMALSGLVGACHPAETAESPSRETGAYSEADVGDLRVLEAARFAVEAIREADPSIQELSLEKIHRAETQVVAGTNFRLRLELQRDGAVEIHDVVVFVQPWTDTTKLTSDSVVPSAR